MPHDDDARPRFGAMLAALRELRAPGVADGVRVA